MKNSELALKVKMTYWRTNIKNWFY